MSTFRPSLPPELHPFRFLTARQVAELTGKKPQTLANERHRGCGIPYVKAGGSIRYALSDVLSFMEAGRVQREG